MCRYEYDTTVHEDATVQYGLIYDQMHLSGIHIQQISLLYETSNSVIGSWRLLIATDNIDDHGGLIVIVFH